MVGNWLATKINVLHTSFNFYLFLLRELSQKWSIIAVKCVDA